MSFVQLKDVCKRYKVGEITISAADSIEFSIEKGELAIILGPSGSGKTTVLNLLGGMDTADGGEIIVDGNDIAKYNRKKLIGYRRNEIGFVFQFYNLIPNLTAKENVELAAQTCSDVIPAEEILTSVGLEERLDNSLPLPAVRRRAAESGDSESPGEKAEAAPLRRAHRRS